MKLFHKVNSTTGNEIVETLLTNDLPPSVGTVGQWSGCVPNMGVAQNTPVAIGHVTELIEPSTGVVTLSPFAYRPALEGFYLVQHKRIEAIYPASTATYQEQLDFFGGATLPLRGLDANIVDVSLVINGATYDSAKVELSATMYCDGDTDDIQIFVRHDKPTAIDFGSIAGLNTLCFTTIWYLGNDPTNGTLI